VEIKCPILADKITSEESILTKILLFGKYIRMAQLEIIKET